MKGKKASKLNYIFNQQPPLFFFFSYLFSLSHIFFLACTVRTIILYFAFSFFFFWQKSFLGLMHYKLRNQPLIFFQQSGAFYANRGNLNKKNVFFLTKLYYINLHYWFSLRYYHYRYYIDMFFDIYYVIGVLVSQIL